MADRLDVILSKLYRGTIRPDMARQSIEKLYPQTRRVSPPINGRPPLIIKREE